MALIEKYVSALAGGSGTGTVGSPYTIDQVVTEIRSVSGTGGQGIRYNIKADGTYGPRSWLDIGGGGMGTNILPIHWRGYKTIPGDGYLGRQFGSSSPLITSNMANIVFNNAGLNGGKWMTFESLKIGGTNGNFLFNLENSSNAFNCVCQNDTTNTYGGAAVIREGNAIWECDFFQTPTSSAANAMVNVGGGGARIFSCRFINTCPTTSHGLETEHWMLLYGCLVKGCGNGIGIWQSATDRPFNLINCTITGWQDAIWMQPNPNWGNFMWGNMVTDNTGYGVNAGAVTDGNCVFIGPNRTRANASGDVSAAANTDWANMARYWPTVTAAGADYVNPSTNDYNLLATSPGRNVNVPAYSDMGAYGGKDPTGGGGTAVFNPLANVIISSAK